MCLLLFLLWIILNGKITSEIIIFGLLIVLFACLFAGKVLGYRLRRELRLYRNIPFFLHYIIVLIREILKAALAVMGLALSKDRHPDPCVIEFRSGLSGHMANVILANSITLTPGTFTLFQEGDRFVVHCLVPAYAQGIEDSSFVRLLRKLH